MKKTVLLILFQIICTSGFSDNPRWKVFGTPIPAHADLDVRWEAPNKFVGSNVPTNKWPSKIWIYSLEPRKFSPKIISSLMAMCSFTEKDKVQQDSNGVTFRNGARILSISFPTGSIQYQTPEANYSPTNLAQGVPRMSEMPKLTKNFLRAVGLKLSEIERDTNGAPNFDFWEPFTVFYLKSGSVTNIAFRAVVFRRAVDGAEVIGDAGYCQLHFGEHGKISQIDFSWPDLKRYESAVTLKPQAIIQLIREGKAHQGLLPMGFDGIDWQTVKSVTVKQAWPCYFGGDSRLYPFLDLWTTVETSQGYVDIEIDCPIVDEAKL
ncbi:MAG: hypothetical protein WCF71_02050 [Verrucomicrobiia bacterium]